MEAHDADLGFGLGGADARFYHGEEGARPEGEVRVVGGRGEENAADAVFPGRARRDHLGDCLPGVYYLGMCG